MSIEYLNKALKVKGLTPTKKFILVLLANYADEGGSCYPSYNHIARVIGLKTSKGVKLAIKEFESLGLLRIENRTLQNGAKTSNRYFLSLDNMQHPMVPEDPRGDGYKDPTPLVPQDPTLGPVQPPNTKKETSKGTNYAWQNSLEQHFCRFYEMYPRKVGRQKAKQKFFDCVQTYKSPEDQKQLCQVLLYCARLFAEEQSATEQKFIPHAATWIFQERWQDFFLTEKGGDGRLKVKVTQKGLELTKDKSKNRIAG